MLLARRRPRRRPSGWPRRSASASSPPFPVDGVTVRVNASIGISLFPEQGDEVSTLLRRADIAMYQAKASRSGYYVYTPASDSLHGQHRLRNLEELRDGDLQPGARRALPAEGRHPARSRSPASRPWSAGSTRPAACCCPDAFLPLVEDAGLMRDLTDAVLEQSLDQVQRWRSAGRMLSVAVNLSASSLVDVELPLRVWSALRDRDLPSDALELEITEDFLMGDRERARAILGDLRRLGIRVAVDDFGTGYSSLAYLRELPIDELKLDRSFVQPMGDDPRAAAIVRSTIDLAHSLGMTMVAEGVEDGATADQLALSSCDKSRASSSPRRCPPPSSRRGWTRAHRSCRRRRCWGPPPGRPHDRHVRRPRAGGVGTRHRPAAAVPRRRARLRAAAGRSARARADRARRGLRRAADGPAGLAARRLQGLPPGRARGCSCSATRAVRRWARPCSSTTSRTGGSGPPPSPAPTAATAARS